MFGLGWSRAEWFVLPAMILFIIVITFLLRILLKNRSIYEKYSPFKYISIFLVILELIKQVVNVIDGFNTWNLPLHYCSMFVFFFSLAHFGGKKINELFKAVAVACSLTMTICFYFSPSSIIGNSCANVFESFFSFHTFVFHHLVILYCALSVALNDYIPYKNDYKKVLVVMTIYSIIALSMSYILNTNYCNFLCGTVEFIEIIRGLVGQIIYTFILFIAISGGTALVSYVYYLLHNKLEDIKKTGALK